MPKSRQPTEVWAVTRRRIWHRDGEKCVHCMTPVELQRCHIDHVQSGKRGSNHATNLRTLCRRCHVLRVDRRHRGMISKG